MSQNEDSTNVPDPRTGLAEQLRQLETFVANAEKDGEELPREAAEMVMRLREIMQALDSLTSSMDPRPGPEAQDAPQA